MARFRYRPNAHITVGCFYEENIRLIVLDPNFLAEEVEPSFSDEIMVKIYTQS